MPYYKKTYRKRYRRRRRPYPKRKSLYGAINRVMNNKLETKKFLPVNASTTTGTNIDGFLNTTTSRYAEKSLGWETVPKSSSPQGGFQAFMKPCVLQDSSLSNNPLNQEGDHIINGRKISPKYLYVKGEITIDAGQPITSYNPMRVCVLKLKDGSDTLPAATTAPTFTTNGGLTERIDTNKYYVIKDFIIRFNPQSSSVEGTNNPVYGTVSRRFKYFKKLGGLMTWDTTGSGDVPTASNRYPTNGIFIWFFHDSPEPLSSPRTEMTYTLAFKDA